MGKITFVIVGESNADLERFVEYYNNNSAIFDAYMAGRPDVTYTLDNKVPLSNSAGYTSLVNRQMHINTEKFSDTAELDTFIHELTHILFPGAAPSAADLAKAGIIPQDPVLIDFLDKTAATHFLQDVSKYGASFFELMLDVFSSLGRNPGTQVQKYNTFYQNYIRGIRGFDSQNLPDAFNPKTGAKCFVAGTRVSVPGGSTSIEAIKPGDTVLAFDDQSERGRGELVARRVTRVHTNFTRELFELNIVDCAIKSLICTPGHHVLDENGEFKSIAELLKKGNGHARVVLEAGELAVVHGRRIVYSEKTAHLFEQTSALEYSTSGSVALAPAFIGGWKTYNFEVEELHTYVAGGVRVHNDSRSLDFVLADRIGADGSHTYFGFKGNSIAYETRYDTNGDGIYDHTRNTVIGDEMSFVAIYELDENGQPIGDPKLDIVDHAGRIITGQQIGEIFGSTIGSAIAGKNQFAQIAAGSVLAAVMGNVAEALDALAHNAGRTVYETGELDVMGAVRYAFDDFGRDLFNQVKSQGIGAISGYLAAELGEALGVGGGFGGQLFDTVTSKSVGFLIGKVLGNIQAGSAPFANLADGFLTNLSAGIGSFVGSYLGRQVVTAKTQAGAIGGTIGSALGAAIGSGIVSTFFTGVGTVFGLALNFALPGIGAFIGVILGTLLGDLFGSERKKPRAIADATLYFADGHFYAGFSDRKHDGDIQFARAMNERTRTLINGYIDIVGGANANSISPIIRTGYNGTDIYAQVWNQRTGVWETKYGKPDEVTEWAVFTAIKLVDIEGGDIYLKRAVANSGATNLRDFLGDLKIAEEYRTYLENKSIIDAIIAADPKSVFAAGWVVTLIRAEELGITKWQKTDFNGGLKGFLHSMGIEKLGGSYEMTRVSLADDKLSIDIRDADGRVLRTIEISEAVSRLGFTRVTGATGTLGRDVWQAAAAGGSFTDGAGTFKTEANDDILIGGNGVDTINAGTGWDHVQGQGGNDTINAGGGNDQVFGGAGDDTIYGDNAADASQIIWSNNEPWVTIDGASYHIQGLDVNQAGADVMGGAGRTWFGVDALPPAVAQDGYQSVRTPFGDDELHGGDGNDTIEGLGGSDKLYGDAGNDILRGGSGDDWLEGGSGIDTLDGGIGFDTVSYAAAAAGITVNLTTGASSDGDTLSNIEDVIGSKFADTIIGSAGDNIIDGGDGADTIDGNGGTDTVSYRSAKAGVVIDLVAGTGAVTVKNPTAGQPDIVTTDALSEIESAIGSDFDDTIIGSAASGKLVGGKGNDTFKIQGDGVTGPLMEVVGGDGFDTLDFSGRTAGVTVDLNYGDTGNKYHSIERIIGGDGNDKIKVYEESQILDGGKGNDDIQGGAGDDVYVFERGDGDDIIRDYDTSKFRETDVNHNNRWVMRGRDFFIDGGDDFLSFGEGISFRHIAGQLTTVTTVATLNAEMGETGTLYGTVPNFTNTDFILALKTDTTLYQSDINGLSDRLNIRLGGEVAQTEYWLSQGQETRDGKTYQAGKTFNIDANAGAIEWLTFENSGAIALKDVRRFVTGTAGADSNLVSATVSSAAKSSWIFAGAGNDTVNGGAQNDIIIGDKDNDILNGGAGDDQYAYWLGDGHDIIQDGAGNDALVFGGGIASTDVRLVRGGLGNPTDPSSFTANANGADLRIEIFDKAGVLSGSITIRNYLAQANLIEEFRFSDTAKTLAEFIGALNGTDFDDEILGTAGDDTINGLGGKDKIAGGEGNDILIGGTGADQLDGGLGRDLASYATATAAVVINMTIASDAETYPDGLFGTGDYAGDRYRNIEGVIGSDFADNITGDAFANELRGGAGNDAIDGGDGDDVIMGGLGADTLNGNTGTDTLSYEDFDFAVRITMQSFAGFNFWTVNYVDATGAVVATGDSVSNFERFRGSTKADIITGDAAANYVEGLGGADTINGNGGLDTVSYETSAKGVSVNLAVTTAQAATFGGDTNGDAAGDILTNIENLTGSAKNDELRGTTGNNVIIGGAGDDLLAGIVGTDTLDGGTGVDTAEFAGSVSDYDIIERDGKIEVHKKTDAATIKTVLTNIEKLKFGSTIIDLTTDKPTIGGAIVIARASGSVSGKLAATDGQSGALTFALDGAAPVNGTFALNANGTYVYTPAAGFKGSETIRVRVTDATGLSSTVEVTLKAIPTNFVGSTEKIVNTTAGDNQLDGTIVALNDGGYFVTWTAGNFNNGYNYVLGQRMNAQGNKVGGQVQVHSSSNLHRGASATAKLADGGFVVTYIMQPRNGSPLYIQAQRYDAQGQSVGAELLVTPATGYARSNPKALGLADGGFIIAWESNGEDGAGYGVYARRFDAQGVAIGDQFRLNATTAGDQRDLALAQLNDGSVIYFWASSGQDGSGFGIYARRFGLDGVALGGEVLINTATASNQNYPSVAKLADGSLIVVWYSETGTNVFARKLLADGTPTGSEFQLNSASAQANYQAEVKVTALPEGGFVAVWRSDNQDSSGAGVYARLFAADGTPSTEEFLVNTTVAGHQHVPAVTILADGSLSFIWQMDDGSGYGIYNRNFKLTDQTLTGGVSDDVLQGGLSNDTFVGGAGADKFLGELGSDTASYNSSYSGVIVGLNAPATPEGSADAPARTGDAVGDIFDSIENLEGTQFSDTLVGNNVANVLTGLSGDDTLRGLGGDDRLVGGSGNDMLEGGAGADALIGGEGHDIVSYAQSAAAVTIDLAASTASGGDAQGDSLTTIEGVEGSASNDTLSGNDDGNTLSGGAGDDVIQGRGGFDTLSGGTGSDDLQGGAGNDALDGGAGDDLLAGGAGADEIDGGAGIDRASYATSSAAVSITLGSLINLNQPGTAQGGDAQGDWLFRIEDIEGSSFADTLTGNELANRLYGLGGNDTLNGGDGDDTIRGDAGADMLDGGSGKDWLDYSTSGQAVVANLATSTVSGGDAQGDTIANFENLIGSGANDQLTGSDGDNEIQAGLGADTLNGGVGNDTLAGGGGADTLDGGSGTDWLDYRGSAQGVTVNLTTNAASGGDAQGDVITNFENVRGSASADTLTGSAGDNVISGLAGADNLDGGDGTDWLDYASSEAGIAVNLATGAVSGGDAQGDTIANFENIRGSAFADTLVGSTGTNTIEAGFGDDVIEGGNGGDWLYGGIGLDTVSYQSSAAAVTVDLSLAAGAAQISIGDASGDRLYDIENVTGSAFGDTLTGSNRIVDGNGLILASGNNTLKGGAGNDTIAGGSGNDQLQGDDGADTLLGDDGDDSLTGGSGADILTGGAGSDTADYSGSTAGVTVSLATGTGTGGDAQGDQLSGIENLTGSAQTDTLTGDGLANLLDGGTGNDSLNGGAGDDMLIGGAGADQLTGGDGIDTASYQTSTAGVIVNLGNVSLNTSDAQGDTYTGIEGLRGSAFNDTLTGSSVNDIISGGLGADTLDGGNGIDTLDYRASAAAVTINLKTKFAAGGEAQGDIFSNFENVSGSAFDDALIGDDGANTLSGNGGEDLLNGLGGADILSGGEGDDLIAGGADSDTLDGGTGTDTLVYLASDAAVTINLATGAVSGGHAQGDIITGFENIQGSAHNDVLSGNSGNNVLLGGAGNDSLLGDAGNDTLAGGAGNDTLTGGAGNDVYRFAKGDGADTIVESGLTADSDQLVFASDIKSDDLWFRQDGNNLVISVLGTDDKVTVQNWFTGSGNEIEEIRAGDGKVLDHSEVQLLINAMSGFQPSSASNPFGIKPEDQLPQQVATVYASTWQLST